MKTKNRPPAQVAAFQRLMDQVTQLTDRANFVRQRCSGLGRMECQTLQLLERFRLRKADLRRRIAQGQLSTEELAQHIPRCMRQTYQEGGLRKEQLDLLPRDMSMKVLADEIGVACSRMTRIGDTLSDEIDPVTGQMRGKGLIHREPSSDDRRVILIRITEAGSLRVRDQNGHAGRMAQLLLGEIPDDELMVMLAGLERYISALERTLPEMVAEAAEKEECQ